MSSAAAAPKRTRAEVQLAPPANPPPTFSPNMSKEEKLDVYAQIACTQCKKANPKCGFNHYHLLSNSDLQIQLQILELEKQKLELMLQQQKTQVASPQPVAQTPPSSSQTSAPAAAPKKADAKTDKQKKKEEAPTASASAPVDPSPQMKEHKAKPKQTEQAPADKPQTDNKGKGKSAGAQSGKNDHRRPSAAGRGPKPDNRPKVDHIAQLQAALTEASLRAITSRSPEDRDIVKELTAALTALKSSSSPKSE